MKKVCRSRDQENHVATHYHLRRKLMAIEMESAGPSVTEAIRIHVSSCMSKIVTPMIVVMMMAMMVMVMVIGVSCFIKHFLNMLRQRLFLDLSHGFGQC